MARERESERESESEFERERERERIRGCWGVFCGLQRPRGDVVTGSNSKASFHRDGRRKNNRTEVSSLVDGEGLGLEDDKIGGLGGFEVLEDETPLGERAPVLLTLVFGEEGHLGWGVLVSLGDPGEDRATQACVASRSLPASSVHLSGTLRELHHVVVLSLELLLVIVAVGLEIPDDLVKGLGSLAETIVVESLDLEGDNTRQDDVLFLDVQLLLGLLRVLLVSQDVAQLGAKNLDGGSLALGDDGESILVNLAGRRDGDVDDNGDVLLPPPKERLPRPPRRKCPLRLPRKRTSPLSSTSPSRLPARLTSMDSPSSPRAREPPSRFLAPS